jgi:hypothetical protein
LFRPLNLVFGSVTSSFINAVNNGSLTLPVGSKKYLPPNDGDSATMTSAALAGSNLLRKWRYSPRCFQPSRDVPDLPASPKLLGLEASAIGFGMDELRGRDQKI